MTRPPADPAESGENPPEGYKPPKKPDNLPVYEPPDEDDRER